MTQLWARLSGRLAKAREKSALGSQFEAPKNSTIHSFKHDEQIDRSIYLFIHLRARRTHLFCAFQLSARL